MQPVPRIPPALVFAALTACTEHLAIETLSATDAGGSAPSTGEPTDTGATTGTPGSTSSAAVCGDAVVQAPEQCDDANQDNTDACLNTCKHATCGDGFVRPPEETCDDGNQDDADACPTSCRPANCGDGFIQAGAELCDDGGETPACDVDCTPASCGDGVLNLTAGEICDDGNDVEDDGCSSACEGKLRVVFVTSQVYQGDLGGLTGADAKCQAAAAAAGLPGTFMAWLSDDTGSPSTRMFKSNGPYGLPDGTRVADNWAGFTTLEAVLKSPINLTESQGMPPVYDPNCDPYPCAFVWSNTHVGEKEPGEYSCAGWTSTQAGSAMGNWVAIDAFWSSAASGGCYFELPLYCFEQ